MGGGGGGETDTDLQKDKERVKMSHDKKEALPLLFLCEKEEKSEEKRQTLILIGRKTKRGFCLFCFQGVGVGGHMTKKRPCHCSFLVGKKEKK